MTSQDIKNQIREALKTFGKYYFEDRGPAESMDINSIVSYLNRKPVDEAIKTMEEVANSDGYGRMVVATLLLDMQSIEDQRWEALMSSPILRKLI
jgi:Ca2+-binding EF-hand superfamily protein